MASLLQTTHGNFTGTSTTITFPQACTQGSLLLCYVGCQPSSRTFTVSDPTNGAWFADKVTSALVTINIWSFPNNQGNTALVVTIGISQSTAYNFIIEEWSGIQTSSPLDVHPPAGQTSAGTTVNVSSGTLASANELVVSACQLSGGGGAGFTVGSPFTPSTQGPSATNNTHAGNVIVSSTSSVTAPWSWTNSVNADAIITSYIIAPAASDTLLGQGWV